MTFRLRGSVPLGEVWAFNPVMMSVVSSRFSPRVSRASGSPSSDRMRLNPRFAAAPPAAELSGRIRGGRSAGRAAGAHSIAGENEDTSR